MVDDNIQNAVVDKTSGRTESVQLIGGNLTQERSHSFYLRPLACVPSVDVELSGTFHNLL